MISDKRKAPNKNRFKTWHPDIPKIVQYYIDEGWSFYMAMSKAGISQTNVYYWGKHHPEIIAIKLRYLDKIKDKYSFRLGGMRYN